MMYSALGMRGSWLVAEDVRSSEESKSLIRGAESRYMQCVYSSLMATACTLLATRHSERSARVVSCETGSATVAAGGASASTMRSKISCGRCGAAIAAAATATARDACCKYSDRVLYSIARIGYSGPLCQRYTRSETGS